MSVASTSSGSTASTSQCDLPWLSRLLKECEAEGEFEEKWPIILMEDLARKSLWYMCSELGVEKHGVPGQACRLLERFFARYLRQYSHLINDPEAWITFKQTLTKRFILLMVTCIRLATKMSSNSIQMNGNKLQTYLATKSLIYSQNQIFCTEVEVYDMLMFNIPLWTSVEVGMMLGKAILKMTSSSLHGVSVLVNLCELHRNDINTKLEWINGSSSPGIRTLHLTVGAVVASSYFFGDDRSDRSDHTVKLAKHTDMNPVYLKSLVNVIIVLLESLNKDLEGPPAKKRL